MSATGLDLNVTVNDGVGWMTLGGLDDPSRLLCATSTRYGGVSGGGLASLNLGASVGDEPANWRVNRERFFRALAIDPDQVSYCRQVHGTRVVEAVSSAMLAETGPILAEADAQMTAESGICLFMTYADCVPIVLYDPVRRAVGLAHAGWRGTIAEVGPQLLRAMAAGYGCLPTNLRAALGPSIGPCCYEVGADVASQFADRWPETVVESGPDRPVERWRVNLWEANRRQLVDVGVPIERLVHGPVCTACNVEHFYSHRRQAGQAGRFAVVAMLR